MKRISRHPSALVATVGTPVMGVALACVLVGCASTTSSTSLGSGSSTTSAGSTTATGTSDVSTSYKDGTYTADGRYSSPDGEEEIAVTVTVKSDLITAVSVSSVESNGEGAQYQRQFESGISSVAVGKSLATLSVSNVAGSSLTSQGFNAALATIRSNAAA